MSDRRHRGRGGRLVPLALLLFPLAGCSLCAGPGQRPGADVHSPGSATGGSRGTSRAAAGPLPSGVAPWTPSGLQSRGRGGGGEAGPDPQPMFRGSSHRNGRTASKIPRHKPRPLWSHRTGRPVFASPTLDRRGRLFVGSLDGTFYALSVAQGSLLWKRPLGGSIFSSAALVQGDPVVGSDGDALFRLAADSGKVIWRLPLGPCPQVAGFGPNTRRCDGDASPLVAPDGSVYMAADALYAISPAGALRWRFPLGGHAFSSVALGPSGDLLVGTQGGALYAVDRDGKERWVQRCKGDLDATPALTAGGLAVLGCDWGHQHAVELASGREAWRVKTGYLTPVRSSAAVAPGGLIVFGSDDGRLRALRPDGATAWTFAAGDRIRSSPTVDAGVAVVFGSQDDHLYALDSSGKLLWKVDLGADVDSSVAVAADGTLLVGCDDGRIHALR